MATFDQQKPQSKVQRQSTSLTTSEQVDLNAKSTSADVLQLQRLIGNQATGLYMSQGGNVQRIARTASPPLHVTTAKRQIQRAGASAEDPLPYITQGMTKKYFHADGDQYGWLETDKKTKEEEFGAYKKLGVLGDVAIPGVKDATTSEDLPYLKDKEGSVAQASLGYWVEHIAFLKNSSDVKYGTIKPKMFAMALNMTAKNIFATLKKDGLLDTAISSLTGIKSNITDISKIVGELTLGVASDGRFLLLDVGTIQNQAGGEELATLGGKGLDNMLTLATKLKDN
jgi:hypothetical protein